MRRAVCFVVLVVAVSATRVPPQLSHRGGAATDESQETLAALAAEYVKWDTNVATRGHIQELINAGDFVALERALGRRLEFGTAGLRGVTVGSNSFLRSGVCDGACVELAASA